MRNKFFLGFIVLGLSGCATSAQDIRQVGEVEVLEIAKPYKHVSQCIAEQIIDKYDAGMSIQTINHGDAIIVKKDEEGGGYFVQVDKLSDGNARVSTYISNNMVFREMLSSKLMQVIKQYCV